MKQIYSEGPETTEEHGQATSALASMLESALFGAAKDPLLATGSLITAILSIVRDCPDERREEFAKLVSKALDTGLKLQAERPGVRIVAALDSYASH